METKNKSIKSLGQDIANNEEHLEGPIASRIEQQTAKIPSDTFLWLALGSIGLSAGLQLVGQKERANFVGHWAPTLLILGLYNKLVKVAGSDRRDQKEMKSVPRRKAVAA